MTAYNYSSVYYSATLSSGINSSATTISVSTATGLPAQPFFLSLDHGSSAQEVVIVTNVSGTTLTVTRGQSGTTAVSHSAGALVRHVVPSTEFARWSTLVDDATIAGLRDMNTTAGIMVQTGEGTFVKRTFNAGPGITIDNPDGSGTISFEVEETSWFAAPFLATFTAASGWSVYDCAFRYVTPYYVHVIIQMERTGADLGASPSTGNMGNETIVTIDADCRPPQTHHCHFNSDASNGGAYISTNGDVTLQTRNPTSVLQTGYIVKISTSYFID